MTELAGFHVTIDINSLLRGDNEPTDDTQAVYSY
jgi:hypothetical protein